MRRVNIETVYTTGNPIDSLEFHQKIHSNGCHTYVCPAWRPGKVLAIDNFKVLNDYLSKLEAATGKAVLAYRCLLEALQRRHGFFATQECRLSGHGLDAFYVEPYTEQKVEVVFLKTHMDESFTEQEVHKYRSVLLYELTAVDTRSGWIQQLHIGVNRNSNKRMLKLSGPDTGFDTIDDRPIAASMNHSLSYLSQEGLLVKTIAYNLSPRDIELMVANTYNFNDGSVPGKMQYRAVWWSLNQIRSMEDQLDALSSLGFLDRFVGILTDSRSLLSYPRHEYFRWTLCNILGNEIEKGLLSASGLSFIGQMVGNISYNNAKRYFSF